MAEAVKQPFLGGSLEKRPQSLLVPNDELRRNSGSEENWRTAMQSDPQCSGLRGATIIDID